MFMVVLITHFMHCFFWVNEDMQRSCEVKRWMYVVLLNVFVILFATDDGFIRFLGPKEL